MWGQAVRVGILVGRCSFNLRFLMMMEVVVVGDNAKIVGIYGVDSELDKSCGSNR
jgi:hypothetical protein